VIIRPVFGIRGNLSQRALLPALLMDGLLIQDIFLHEVGTRSWRHVRTTEFVSGIIFLVIWNPRVEKSCTAMISTVTWLPSKLSGIQRFRIVATIASFIQTLHYHAQFWYWTF
jgi:glucose-6-phosphate 1-dehydrogenase